MFRTNFVQGGSGTIDMAPNDVAEMARLLRINLDPETLSLCCQLLEEGANPEALAALLVELQRETTSLKR